MNRKEFLTVWQLKLIALFFMTLEHVTIFFADITPDYLEILAKSLGRIAAPLFIFLSVEAFLHTKNRVKYILRLGIAAIVMALGNTILMRIAPVTLEMNIFASLALGTLFLSAFEIGLNSLYFAKKILYFLIAIIIVMFSLFTEGGYLVPLLYLVFYLSRNSKLMKILLYAMVSMLFLLPVAVFPLHQYYYFEQQFWMILAIPLLFLYSGKRGPHSSYLMYAYYPVHIWVLALLTV